MVGSGGKQGRQEEGKKRRVALAFSFLWLKLGWFLPLLYASGP